VVLIDSAPHVLPSILDLEMASVVEAYLKSEGVTIYTNCYLKEVTESGEAVTIKTAQMTIEVDCAVIAVGVKPNSKLAVDCGLAVGKTGGIVVDDKMETSEPDIFAAGDCVEVKHLISGKPLHLPLGSLANRQGRAIGSNLGGGDERFGPVVGSVAVKIFDMNVATTGLNEVAGKAAGFDVGCAWGTFTDKADYYPESQNIHFKLIFDKGSGCLLGLQGCGKGEVVKNINVFAALLKNGSQLEDLLDIEAAYAPPYANGLDPLFSLGCIAMDALHEDVQSLSPKTPFADRVIIDVRRNHEVNSMPMSEEGVLNIPFEEIRSRWEEIPKNKPLICICSKGLRSAESVRFLKAKGFSDITYLGGGYLMRPAN
jgi:pyruvate/2-oxoglutarate dehydrogenase complex dihydrolipoamide dehydrogenase (E3) component/rhodanese-related sulfurtransferase